MGEGPVTPRVSFFPPIPGASGPGSSPRPQGRASGPPAVGNPRGFRSGRRAEAAACARPLTAPQGRRRGKKRRAGRGGRGGLPSPRLPQSPAGPRVGSAGTAAGSRPRSRPGPALGKRRRRGGRAATIECAPRGPRHRAPAARSARAPG